MKGCSATFDRFFVLLPITLPSLLRWVRSGSSLLHGEREGLGARVTRSDVWVMYPNAVRHVGTVALPQRHELELRAPNKLSTDPRRTLR